MRSNALPIILPALSLFPSPIAIEASGAPPTPTKLAKAPIIVTTGPHTPTPANALTPIPAR